jgi:hypothetical protein
MAVVWSTGCDVVFDLDGVEPPDAPLPGYRKQIAIRSPATTALENFPLSVLIKDDPDLAAHVFDDLDIAFTDASGGLLPCEVVDYDAATGSLDAWVLLPQLTALPATTTIDLQYGVPVQPCVRTAAWPTTAVGVWHAGLDTDRTDDSTRHGHALVAPSATRTPQPGAGIVGTALLYDGVDDTLCDPVDDDGSLAFGTGSFSYGIWVNLTSNVGDFDQPLGMGGSSQSAIGFNFELGLGEWKSNLSDGVHTSTLETDLLATPALGRWVQLYAVVDREANVVSSYVDGIARTTNSLTGWGALDTTRPLCLGHPYDLIHGVVDEARVYATALAPAWIAVEHANFARRDDMML